MKTADKGYVGLYGCWPKSVTAGFGCSIGCTPALSDSQTVCDDSAAEAAYAATVAL